MEDKIRLYEDFIRTLKRVMQMYRRYELEQYEAQLEMASTFDEYFPWAKESEEVEEDEDIIHLGEVMNKLDEIHETDKRFCENVLKKVKEAEERVPELADEDFTDGIEEFWRECGKPCEKDNDYSVYLSDMVTILDNINTAIREIAQQLNDKR